MANDEPVAGAPAHQGNRSDAWKTAVTVLQEAKPPSVPEGAHVMTLRVEFPPGDPGTPPHRHLGPAFGYVVEGEMVFRAGRGAREGGPGGGGVLGARR